MDARTRLEYLFDDGSITKSTTPISGSSDPLQFVDTKPYAERLQC